MLTTNQLKAIVPGIKPGNLQVYTDQLNIFMPKYDITTPARICPFLANIAEESGSFNYTREIASGAAYEGRHDLGNNQPGDGERFKGRGLIQLTGRGVYEWCSRALYKDRRLIDTPELLEQPAPATESACWFWKEVKNLNLIADSPDTFVHTRTAKNGGQLTYGRFEWIVFLINGGQNGLAHRQVFYNRAKTVII